MSTAQLKSKPKSERTGSSDRQGDGAALLRTNGASPASLGPFYSAGPVFGLGAPVQTKLQIGRAGDPYEQEADAVAERVTTGRSAPPISSIPTSGLNGSPQRQTAEEEEPLHPMLIQRAQERGQEEAEEEPQNMPAQPMLVQRQGENGEEGGMPIQPLLVQRQCTECESEEEPQNMPAQPMLVQRQEADGEEPEESSAVQAFVQRQEVDEEEPEESSAVQPFVQRQEVDGEESEESPAVQAFVQRQEVDEEEPEESSTVQAFVQRQEVDEEEPAESSTVQTFVHRQEVNEEEPEENSAVQTFIQRQEADEEEPEESSAVQTLVQRQEVVEEDLEPDGALQKCNCTGTCSCGASDVEGEQKSEKAIVQNSETKGSIASQGSTVRRAIRAPGAGEPLRSGVRQAIEGHTGMDMSDVRVHRNTEATRALRARAFTHGDNIWLGSGESSDNLRLMAHEATHVIQQGAAHNKVRSLQRTAPGVRDGLRQQVASGKQIVQRALYVGDNISGWLGLRILFGGDVIFHIIPIGIDVAPYFYDDPMLAQDIEDELTGIFNPVDQPLHETTEYLGGPAVEQLIIRGIRAVHRTGSYSFSALANLLQQRTALFHSQNLLPGATDWLADRLAIDPPEIDWDVLIPELQLLALEFEPVTLTDASLDDRYLMILDILANEAANLPAVVGATSISAEDANTLLLSYMDSSGRELFTDEVFTYHSEKFLEEYIPLIEAIRYVPENFNLESYRPVDDTSAIDEGRETIIADFLEFEAPNRVVMYILDRWTESAQSPEDFLGSLDIEEFRTDLIAQMASELVDQARRDPELMAALRSRAFDQARFIQVEAICRYGLALELQNQGLWDKFNNVPLDELSVEDYAIAADPYAYYDLNDTIASVLLDLLASLSPDGPIELQTLQAGMTLLETQDIPYTYAGLLLLPELLGYLEALKQALEEQESETQRALEDRLDLDFDDIAEIVRNHAEHAESFIQNEWFDKLKEVATEMITANRDELQMIYDNWDIANEEFILRASEGAEELESLARGLEEGSYESIEMDGQVVYQSDATYLRDAAQFLRDEAEIRRDPERTEEKKSELQEAIDVYETVKDDIENDEYNPLHYSREVYVEARARLGISEFPEFTTVGMVLKGEVTAHENPFLAQAIVGWRWREGVEEIIETGLLLAGLGILSVAAMLVPGIGGFVLFALDIGISIGLGIQGIADAEEVLNMARLDTHQDIRGISVDQAERALTRAWIGLGVDVLLTAGPFALTRAVRIRGAAGRLIRRLLPREMRGFCRIGSINCRIIPDQILNEVSSYPRRYRIPFPSGSFRLQRSFLSGVERDTARLRSIARANRTSWPHFNRALRNAERSGLDWPLDDLGRPWQVHHIKPVSFGGGNAPSNLVPLSPAIHQRYTNWWNSLHRQFRNRFSASDWDDIMLGLRNVPGSRVPRTPVR